MDLRERQGQLCPSTRSTLHSLRVKEFSHFLVSRPKETTFSKDLESAPSGEKKCFVNTGPEREEYFLFK